MILLKHSHRLEVIKVLPSLVRFDLSILTTDIKVQQIIIMTDAMLLSDVFLYPCHAPVATAYERPPYVDESLGRARPKLRIYATTSAP